MSPEMGGKKIHIHPATLLPAPLLRSSQRNALFWKVTLCDEQNEIVKCPTVRQFLCSRRGLNMPHMVYTSFFMVNLTLKSVLTETGRKNSVRAFKTDIRNDENHTWELV